MEQICCAFNGNVERALVLHAHRQRADYFEGGRSGGDSGGHDGFDDIRGSIEANAATDTGDERHEGLTQNASANASEDHQTDDDSTQRTLHPVCQLDPNGVEVVTTGTG